jgi:hypothetical protein
MRVCMPKISSRAPLVTVTYLQPCLWLLRESLISWRRSSIKSPWSTEKTACMFWDFFLIGNQLWSQLMTASLANQIPNVPCSWTCRLDLTSQWEKYGPWLYKRPLLNSLQALIKVSQAELVAMRVLCWLEDTMKPWCLINVWIYTTLVSCGISYMATAREASWWAFRKVVARTQI